MAKLLNKNKKVVEKKEAPKREANKEVEKLVETLNKKFGAKTLNIGCPDVEKIKRIPTGSLTLDIALGGGIPQGRFSEISGAYSSTKSTQSLHIIREAQHMGLTCALLDVERTTTEDYLEQLGVDTSNLIYCNPSGTEEATQLLIEMQRSKLVHLAVLDSIASMSPTKELDSDMDETVRMGIPQQLLGEYFRKYQALNNKLAREGNIEFTLIGINQLREKIGCFHYTSKVLLADGSTEMIGKIVNNKMQVEVMSYNHETKEIEPRKITNWFNNGVNEEEFITIFTDKPQRRGKSCLACTSNHEVLTPTGYVEAGKLKVGDKIMQTLLARPFNEVQKDILIGSMLGDGSIRKECNCSYHFRLSHSKEQEEYLRWKASFFEGSVTKHKKGFYQFDSLHSFLYEDYYKEWYKDDTVKHFIPKDLKLTPLSLAVWFMDDGSFNNQSKKSIEIYTNTFDLEGVTTLINILYKDFGVECDYRVKDGDYVIVFSRPSTKKFLSIIGQYIHPCMSYKLGDFNRPSFIGDMLESPVLEEKYINRETTIRKIGTRKKDRHIFKYDIEVEGNHNYIVSNLLVHNSYGDAEYTPGGRAKSFTSSVDLRLRKGDWISEGSGENKEIVGQVVKFKIDKNKTFKRMQTGEFDFYFTENNAGVESGYNDRLKEIVLLAVEYGIIQRRGAWFYLSEEDKFQGLDKLVEYLKTLDLKDMEEQIKRVALKGVY